MPFDPTVQAPLDAIQFIVLGLFVGAYGTLVGAGGGFLLVPLLLLIYHATPQQAVGTSLTVVFFNALSGTASYARHRRVDYRSGLIFAAATIPGAIGGALISTYLTSRLFYIIFGILLLAIAGFMIAQPERRARELGSDAADPATRGLTKRTLVDARGHSFSYAFDLKVGVLISFGVGFLSSILGIGGGIIHVPALVLLLFFPAHIATATSHFILAISALVGASSHIALGHILPLAALFLAIGVVAGAQVGAALSQRLHGRVIVRLLAVALAVVALRLLAGAI